ncbi:MAG: UvrD-helicase domain-containing protein, partial [Acidimicrobiia bacterium]
MKRRVMRLLQEEVVPERVLACTFTRTAARDIAREIANLGVERAGDVWAGTLHGLCFSILRRQEVLATGARGASPGVVGGAIPVPGPSASFAGVKKAGKRLKAFSAAWARLY